MRQDTEQTNEGYNTCREFDNCTSLNEDPYQFNKNNQLNNTGRIFTPQANALQDGRIVFPSNYIKRVPTVPNQFTKNEIKSVSEIDRSISKTSLNDYYDNSQVIGRILEN